MLKVPKTIPNPKFIPGEENVIRIIQHVRNAAGRYEARRIGIPIARTIANPDFDRLSFHARMMPTECEAHRALRAAKVENAILVSQERHRTAMEINKLKDKLGEDRLVGHIGFAG